MCCAYAVHAHSSLFIPLQTGEHAPDPVASRRTTSSESYQATRVSSPHAAAATRRFLAVNSSMSRPAGGPCCCLRISFSQRLKISTCIMLGAIGAQAQWYLQRDPHRICIKPARTTTGLS